MLAAAAAVVLLLLLAVRYLNFLEDDALISATYAQRLIDGKGLTWTDGTRVEGYSNLLWVLAVALVGLVEPDLVTSLRILAVTCCLATTVLLGFWPAPRKAVIGAASIAAIAFATSGPVAVWTCGGLEQPLLALLLVSASSLFLAVLENPARRPGDFMAPGVVFGLVCLVRPDAPLFCVPAAIAVLIDGRDLAVKLHTLLCVSLGPIVALIGAETFRLLYYDAWVPNTALVKLSPSGAHFDLGLQYVAGGWQSIAPIAILAAAALISAVLTPKRLPTAVYLVTGPCLWSAYLIVIGGGIFSGYRHFVPVVAILAVAIAHAGEGVVARHRGRAVPIVAALAVAALIAGNVSIHVFGTQFVRATKTSWVWAGRDIALLLVDAYGEQRPTLAVTAAGSIPFWTGFPCIDMLGLNDRTIARYRPENLGLGVIGHEHGDGAYVLARRPDIIQPCGPWGGLEPCYRAVREIHSTGMLQRLYAPVTLSRPPAPGNDHIHTTVWLRRDSALVGIRRIGDAVIVPATLGSPVGSSSGAAWVLGPGQVAAPMSAGRAVDFRLPAGLDGPWSVRLEPPSAADIEIAMAADTEGGSFPVIRVLPQTSALIRSVILMPEPAGR